MAGLITCAGADVVVGRISLPDRGPWYADLVLDTATVPSGSVTIAADGGLSIAGTIQRADVVLDVVHCRVIGGAGGLGTIIDAAAYENAQLSDPLNAILDAAGEKLSSKVETSITSTLLAQWTNVAQSAAAALDRITYAAGQATGKTLIWRVLDDGAVWLGEESWPTATLPGGADVLMAYPAEKRVEIGVVTPALLPGVDLADVGKVVAVDHWLQANQIRTWAWL